MIILKNHEVDNSFVEKEIKFSLKNGMKVEDTSENGKIKLYFKVENDDNYRLSSQVIPPINLIINSLILEFNINDNINDDNINDDNIDDNIDDDLPMIANLKILKDPSYSIKLDKSNLIQSRDFDASATIKIPEELIGLPIEVELCQPDSVKFSTTSSNNMIKIREKVIDLYNLNGLFEYRLHMRVHFGKEKSNWSNNLIFKPKKRRTIGRTW